MEVIHKGRGEGKTTELIKMSAETGKYILTPCLLGAQNIQRMAQEMKLTIPFPITVGEVKQHGFRGSFIKSILIDDADIVLQQLLGVKVDAITVTKKDGRMTNEELIKRLTAMKICTQCEISGKPCDDNCKWQYEAGNMGEIVQTLEQTIEALKQMDLLGDYSAYERGLNDAWECAKKIYNDNTFSVNEEIFGKGRSHFGKITDDYSASEAIAKIKAYEKQTNPISIDEAINNLKHGSSIPYKRETLTLAIKALERMKGETEE